jgi:60 kDa SS-A/Ro ribonucleoprotein
MVHPVPQTPARSALYAYLIGREHDAAALPACVQAYEAFKGKQSETVPDVPFQMLTATQPDGWVWQSIARNASWQTLRMNLNTFARHDVFKDRELARRAAGRLGNPQAVRNARAFPYQLMVAYMNAHYGVPENVRDALQNAMEVAIENVPAIDGSVVVCPDVSGSMQSPVTGHRKGSTTAVRCVDVAALFAASIVRKNGDARVIPFHDDVVKRRLNPRDSVMTNAQRLANCGTGGTNCSAPLAWLNEQKAKADVVIFVSDNESWVDARPGHRGTATMEEWNAFRVRNPRAKLVCIDIQPYETVQAVDREDILNVGGFSDAVFETVATFAAGQLAADHWVGVVDRVKV